MFIADGFSPYGDGTQTRNRRRKSLFYNY